MSNESGSILVPGLVCLSCLPSNEKQQRDILEIPLCRLCLELHVLHLDLKRLYSTRNEVLYLRM